MLLIKIFTKKSTIISNTLLLIMLSSIILIINNIYEHNLYSIAKTALFSYFVFYVTWAFHYKIRLNYYTIFLTATMLFYFGQFFLLLIGVEMDSGRTIIDGLLPYYKIIETGKYIINFMVVLHLGVIFSTFNINIYNYHFKQINNTHQLNSLSVNNFKKIAILLFIVSIIPSFLILIKNIQITLSQGYGQIFQSSHYVLGGLNNISRFVSRFTIPSFLMLFIAYKNDKRIIIICVIMIMYLIAYFLSGSRLAGVLLLSSLLLIRHYWYKPINIKASIIMVPIAFFGIGLLSSISKIRNLINTTNNINTFIIETFRNVILQNPIFLAIEEAGYTFLATTTVITYSPLIVPHYFGMSYINSILMLIPNLFWDVHPAANINTDIVFKSFLTKYGGIGSSFIAESYWNFGYFSLILSLAFGIFIGIITKNIAKYAASANSKMFYLSIYIGHLFLFYVRSDTVSFWRNFIYYGIVPLLIISLLSQIRTKRE